MPVSGMAQGLGRTTDDLTMRERFWIVAGKVKTVQGDPVRGATVTVTPPMYTSPRILATDAQGEFRSEYAVIREGGSDFSAIVTVKKKGFQTAHAFVNYGRSDKTWWVPFTLHERRMKTPTCSHRRI